MVLVNQGGSLLRTGLALASGSACCCEQKSPYSVCANRCAFRVQVKELDSEMAACAEASPDELPEGWQVLGLGNCENANEFFLGYPAPWIEAEKSGANAECDSYEGIVDERYCTDRERAGITNVPGILGYVVGGARTFSRSGYTTADRSGEWSYKTFGVLYDIGIYCSSATAVPSCAVCGGASLADPSAYYIAAYMIASVREDRYFGLSYVGSASIDFTGSIGGWYEAFGAVPFLTQTCDEMNSFDRLSQYDCYEAPATGCRPVQDFFPPDPLEITLSLDEGVTVGGDTFPWAFADTQRLYNAFEIDFPDDLKEPGGITIYRAAKCCCSGDYCNPLP